ncbi:MAG: tripartite tricarboxylate transporter substrate binding protein [Desulfuromonadales bacterium]|nr:tripartite tricarboxylate transporter substrate binding protein [Desulfuromonadales bacterium]MBN2792036.1 tripartite tricarboxylate transporter substrate binding protein [Desulfuromonadales bacterium]
MNSISKKIQKLLAVPLLIVCALALSGVSAQAAFTPDKTVHVIVHTSPGGGVDTMARLTFKHAARLSGVNFVVENFAGAGGQIGYTKLSMSKPDGYTLGTISTMSIVTHELTRKNVPYTFKDNFQPVARITLDPSVLAVKTDSKYKTLDDLLADAKANPDKLSFAGTFTYSTHHIHDIVLQKQTGTKFKYIPYDGGAKAIASLLGGHVDVAASGLSEFAPLIKSGEVRILASAGDNQWKSLPEMTLYKDAGYKISLGSNRGISLPAGAPADIVKYYDELLTKVANDPEFLAEAEKISIAPTIAHLGAAAFTEYLTDLQAIMAENLAGQEKK